jgi:hypothetical protein
LQAAEIGTGEVYGSCNSDNDIGPGDQPLGGTSARFEFAARKLNLEEGLWKMLSTPSREIIVHFPGDHG